MPEISDIEVKYAIQPADAANALDVLTAGKPPGSEYEVWFFDDQERSLLEKGFILRVRFVAAEPGKSDSTVKLREPADANGSAGRLGVGEQGGPPILERKLEGDLNVNAATKASYSATIEPPPVQLQDVLAGKKSLRDLFYAPAVAEMAGVKWEELRAYGPIPAQKWKLPVDGLEGNVSVESWDAGGKILVEVSDKKKPGKAKELANAIGSAMEKLKLKQLPGSKTEFALAHAPSRALGVGGSAVTGVT